MWQQLTIKVLDEGEDRVVGTVDRFVYEERGMSS